MVGVVSLPFLFGPITEKWWTHISHHVEAQANPSSANPNEA